MRTHNTHIEFLDSLYSFQIQIEGELSALRCRIVRDQFNRIQSPVVCCLPIQAPISCVGWLTLKNIKIEFNSSVPGIPPVPPYPTFIRIYSHRPGQLCQKLNGWCRTFLMNNIPVPCIVVLRVLLLLLDTVTLIPFNILLEVLRLEKVLWFFSAVGLLSILSVFFHENKLNYYSSFDITMPRSITVFIVAR